MVGTNTSDLTKKIKDTLDVEWGRSQRIKRTYTELGFSTGRVPGELEQEKSLCRLLIHHHYYICTSCVSSYLTIRPLLRSYIADLWTSFISYYNNNAEMYSREEWESKAAVHVNWWEVDAFMIGMPWRLKK